MRHWRLPGFFRFIESLSGVNMKAAVMKEPGVLELEDLPDAACPKGGALVKVEACSVCGTDIKMLKNGHKDLIYPRVPGHEITGRILEVDDDDQDIKAGDLVQVWPGIACGKCKPCLKGDDNRCERMGILGFNRDGGFAELIALPPESVRKLTPIEGGIDPCLVSLAEPLACCINGQKLTGVFEGDSVLILGGGPIGCLHALLAGLTCAERIIVAEKLENRVGLIKENVACSVINTSDESLESAVMDETDGRGADVILTATPEIRVDDQVLRLLSPGGRACVFSGPGFGNRVVPIDLRSMHYRELTVVGAYGCTSRQNGLAVKMIQSGALNLEWLLTMRTSLDRIKDAFLHTSDRRGLKSVIDDF